MLLKPKNWAHFQHYKDRCPPWIKLHRDLLNNRDFMRLPIASKALAPMLWLLASESKDGAFDGSLDELVFRLHITEKEYKEGIKPLIDKGFFLSDSELLAESKQGAIPERETERETETKREKKEQQRGSRLPVDFVYPKEWADFCLQTRPDLNLQNTFDEFKDYWTALPAGKGTKADWFATWRNWVRRQNAPKAFVNKYDVAHVTTPPPPNQDAALRKIEEDRKRAAPIPENIRAKMVELLKGKVA
jgi:hypothetical protein